MEWNGLNMELKKTVFTYLAGSSVQKIVERSISATPLPTNTFFPWKLVAPRVHLPSRSEKTDTKSPAFMSNKKTKQHTVRFKEDNQHLEQMKILWQKVKRASKSQSRWRKQRHHCSKYSQPHFTSTVFKSYIWGCRGSPGRRRERLSVRRRHTERPPPPLSRAASQVWEYRTKNDHTVTEDTRTKMPFFSLTDSLLAAIWGCVCCSFVIRNISCVVAVPLGCWRTSEAQVVLSATSTEQIKSYLKHSSHTSDLQQEGSAHPQFVGVAESAQRLPLLTSCTSAARKTMKN